MELVNSMAWYAKPSGGYQLSSTQGTANINEIYSTLSGRGYTVEAVCGVCGNVMAESGLNPWRWESDTYNLSKGYGLFQYTPASGYIDGAINVDYYSPNLSTSEQTAGASANDGIAQLVVMDTNLLGKWVSSCWRVYWDKNDYPKEYKLRQYILDTYGNGSTLSLSQFRTIDVTYFATFAFLACFEGPANLRLESRYNNAVSVYELLTGQEPIIPPWDKRKGLPIWMMVRYGF